MIERILVPTDMTSFSDLALRYALLFHKRLGAKITLLHADEISWLAAEHPLGYYFENVPEAKAALAKSLSDYAAGHVPPEVGATTLFEDEAPERAIVETARDIGADLIIMGTHGRSGLRRALLGSVTERVLHTTNIPVISVAPAMFPRDPDVTIKTILCPVNFTAIARLALERACGMAEAFDADLVVMHVVEGSEPQLFSAVESEFRTWVDPVIRASTRFREVIVRGSDAAERVLTAADQIGADLLVIGAQHRAFSDTTVVGTTTEMITRFARHAVMTVMRPPAKQRSVAAA